jgi:ABC-2 type transport system permease protein
MFRTLLAKEAREQWRTWKVIILAIVLFISGCASPILAKYTPALLRSIPDIPPALAAMIPEPTLNDAILQYVKNASQFGVLLVVVLMMGAIAQEKERGTAAMLLTKPVRPSAVVLAKWLVSLGSILVSVLISALGCVFYTYILFKDLLAGDFIKLNALLIVFFAVYLSVTLLASTLARTQGMAAAIAFGGTVVLLVLSSLPRISDFMPSQLLSWGQSNLLGQKIDSWPALWIAFGIILVSLALACLRFEREEI